MSSYAVGFMSGFLVGICVMFLIVAWMAGKQ